MSNQFYCGICGGLFNLKSQKGNRKMWCDDCKPLAEKLYQAEYYKRRKGEIDQLRAALAAKDAEIERLQTAIGEWKVQAHGAGVRADNAERRETHLRSTLAAKNAEIERLREGLRSIYGELGYCIYGSPTDGKGQAKAMLRCYGTAEKALANAAPEPEPETCAWEDRGLDGWWPGCCDERDDGCSKWEYPAAPETCPGCGKRVEVRG